MKTINVLDASIFNRIAAGEVVENPRSIVKELVENSIDAGADAVTVEIRGGGISYISVTDNGKGLSSEDMALAFLPHATSKIASVDDLDAICTLGFRGEALPSIASVASVEMISRTQGSELGYTITLLGGKIVQEGECGAPYGTKVIVRDLFAEIPARAKFLRKPQAEEGSITEFIEKMILANPTVKFKFVADGETVYQSSGTDAQSALFELYGKRFVENMQEVCKVHPDVTVRGLIGKPNFTKHNRTYQTLVVNGRFVINQEFSYCIQQCYQPYLMKRQFPVYLLYIDLPADRVDVNVHPNKLDVRFADNQLIKGIVYNLIKTTVDMLAAQPMQFVSVQSDEESAGKAESDWRSPQTGHDTPAFEPLQKQHAFDAPLPRGSKIGESTEMQARLDDFIRAYQAKPPVSEAEPHGHTSRHIPAMPKVQQCEQTNLGLQEDFRYAGKLFNTYLLFERGENIYLIDQHAAHEKLLYDKLTAQVNGGQTALQDLLVPYIFEVTPTECAMLTECLPQLNACGFKIDPLSGNTFSLYALPVCCANMNLRSFISILLTDVDKTKSNADLLKETLMQAACKSAVKGEDDLSQSEIDALLTQMLATESARFCPHGRPTVIRYARADLEKIFKRIV